MTESPTELHIAEHGLATTIEAMISAPEKLGITEANAAARLRIIAHLLTLPETTIGTLEWNINALKALTARPRS